MIFVAGRFPSLVAGLLRSPCSLLTPRRSVGLLTRLTIVDNSENAKKVTRLDRPYCIKLPKNSREAGFGEVITIAHLGKVHKALVVSNRRPSKKLPRYDTHNIILLNDKLEPVGTRIMGPVPSVIRKRSRQLSKVIAIATKFI
ncbi:39S ribosomal protein L14, mitochondrial [Geodia barretti]|uniref:39S ribosomal protein L14, mitochondrial n=1 Tax=Geodia barretti TaxID=519541 RepID=A0AA35TR34_GEOBA|nr:39S ribosomal protein L14, mitochondrial [Geodia barretti]